MTTNEVGLDQVLDDTDVLTNENEVEEAKAEEIVEAKEDKDDLDFGSLSSVPGVVVGKSGTTVSRFPVDKARFTVSARSRISLISNKVIIIKTVYDEEISTNILVTDDLQLKGSPKVRVRYLYPCLIYETDRKGVIQSNHITNAVLVLGYREYSDLVTIEEVQNTPLNNIDIVVTCNDEKYQSKTFTVAGAATWKKSAKIKQQVIDFWKRHIKDIVLPVATAMTQQEYDEKKGIAQRVESAPDTISSEEDLSSYFSD